MILIRIGWIELFQSSKENKVSNDCDVMIYLGILAVALILLLGSWLEEKVDKQLLGQGEVDKKEVSK